MVAHQLLKYISESIECVRRRNLFIYTYKYEAHATQRSTHMAVLVQLVVRQLQLVERDDLLHPCGAGRRRIGMQVDARRRDRIGLAGHHPAGAVRTKSTVV